MKRGVDDVQLHPAGNGFLRQVQRWRSARAHLPIVGYCRWCARRATLRGKRATYQATANSEMRPAKVTGNKAPCFGDSR